MERILVTGATGLLGMRLVPYLQSIGHVVVTQSRSANTALRHDLNDADSLSVALDNLAPTVIVHLAALTNVDACEAAPSLAYAANVRPLESLRFWLSKNTRVYLVNISTDQVYDGQGPHLEKDPMPTNYYAFSKYAGELVAQTVSSAILRTNFFGWGRHPVRRTISDWILQELGQGKAINAFKDICFNPLNLPSLLWILGEIIKAKPRGIFNVGSHGGISKADLAFALARAFAYDAGLIRVVDSTNAGLKAYRPRDMRMNCLKIEAEINVRLPSLEDEIKFFLDEYHVATS